MKPSKKLILQHLIYFFSPQFTLKFVKSLISNKFFGVISYLIIIVLPFCIVITPHYWNFFFHSPKFFFSTLIFLFLPFIFLICQKFLRNPFFILPFSISFILSTQTYIYFHFLEIFLFFIGIGIYSLVEARTPIPYIFTEYILEATSFFTGYQEAHTYWKISLKIIIPLFLVICIILQYLNY